MALKLMDTVSPAGDFEIAEAKDIAVDIKGTKKMLQKAIDDGDIGSGGGSSLIDDETVSTDKTWSSQKISESLLEIDDTSTTAENKVWSAKKVNASLVDIKNTSNYTEEEVEIGTWLGKKLYRKTFKGTIPIVPNTRQVVSLTGTNGYMGVSMKGFIKMQTLGFAVGLGQAMVDGRGVFMFTSQLSSRPTEPISLFAGGIAIWTDTADFEVTVEYIKEY